MPYSKISNGVQSPAAGGSAGGGESAGRSEEAPRCQRREHGERREPDESDPRATPTELQALGDALNEAEAAGTEHPSAILALRLLALTGFRRSEVLGQAMKDRRGPRDDLRWGDIDLDGGLVHLHDTKTGRQTRTIGAAAIELLEKARPARPKRDDLVCPGDKDDQAFVGIDKVRRRLWRAASLEGIDLHSLRHTFASIGVHVQNGRFAAHVSALLGHGYQSKAITERYITANPAALQPAADAIAGELARLLGLGAPRRVVEFPNLARS